MVDHKRINLLRHPGRAFYRETRKWRLRAVGAGVYDQVNKLGCGSRVGLMYNSHLEPTTTTTTPWLGRDWSTTFTRRRSMAVVPLYVSRYYFGIFHRPAYVWPPFFPSFSSTSEMKNCCDRCLVEVFSCVSRINTFIDQLIYAKFALALWVMKTLAEALFITWREKSLRCHKCGMQAWRASHT